MYIQIGKIKLNNFFLKKIRNLLGDEFFLKKKEDKFGIYSLLSLYYFLVLIQFHRLFLYYL